MTSQAPSHDWHLECSACGKTEPPVGLPTVCSCGLPWLVRYPDRSWPRALKNDLLPRRGLWRFREFLPITADETPVTLGEGDTPLLRLGRSARRLGFSDLWMKDEAANPTGSFKARGLTAAVTRASLAGVTSFTLPTAGNAGVAASAYGARAGARVRVFAPRTTPATILAQIVTFGAELVLLEGHIGDCGRAARAWAAESNSFDLSTLREPYRIEGKKTLGLELALQFDWTLPDAIIYPTGGGTGLIGMWKAFEELAQAGWVERGRFPKMFSVQSAGCAPVVEAFDQGATECAPWPEPATRASGLRVPHPLGGRLILEALRESGGAAVAVADERLTEFERSLAREEGIDLSPEGAATVAALVDLESRGLVSRGERIVLFNTGAGWLYRDPASLPGS
jgi:threonine synthase